MTQRGKFNRNEHGASLIRKRSPEIAAIPVLSTLLGRKAAGKVELLAVPVQGGP